MAALAFDAFATYLAVGLRMDPDGLTPATHLSDDLGLESFDLLELLTLVEELGVNVPDAVAANVQTLGEVYDHYRSEADAA